MYEEYASSAFENEFTYSGNDLGCTWTPRETFFRLWAPTAHAVTIRFYATGNPEETHPKWELPMTLDREGTWIARQDGDINGVYYTYLVTLGEHQVEACDPYARTTGVNGHRAMVLDLAGTNPEGWETDRDPHYGAPITDAVICELHVRDLTSQRGYRFKHRGKFLGLTETGHTTKGGAPVGMDHIRSLGVTHVHLLPIFDYASVDESRIAPSFNWGYDPSNFNTPEGSYATDPFHGAVRVRELKQTIKHLHDQGISVIMDVVYNHVFAHEDFCFNKIVPNYFTRMDSSGKLSDGSCCGNDTASERSMVRKYIVDSVLYWADEYHIDGFRFDLVGLLDTQVIQEIMQTVHRSHPNVIFYGEGWSMNTQLTKPGYSLAVQGNSGLLPGFSFFSDTTRDMLRGSIFKNTTPGFLCGGWVDRKLIDACFMGMPSWSSQPYQCVNYASCHDNNTLFDRIALASPDASVEDRIRMNNLSAAFCMLSQGVPFFQAGEELLRTKPGSKPGQFTENSFCSPDRINSIKWDTLDRPEYQQVVRYYRGLIAFRKAHPALRLSTRKQVTAQVQPIPCDNSHAAVYRILEDTDELYVIFNADKKALTLSLPDGSPWNIHIQGSHAGVESLGQVCNSVTVEPISAMVLSRKRLVDVVAALIWEKDKFLICQRPAGKPRELLWEFVGGKVELGETLQQALVRECREELDIEVTVHREFVHVIHDYPDIHIRLSLFHCVIASGTPKLLEHNDMTWIHPSQVGQYAFCPADKDILQMILSTYGKNPPLSELT